jgi:hypothetical protein
MAKKTAKKVARKNPKTVASKRGREAIATKPGRAGRSHVSFGVHGMTKIVRAVKEAGLESDFNEAIEHDDKFVKMRRKSLESIRDFVESKPGLADLAREMRQCDCPPDDPYCIYI